MKSPDRDAADEMAVALTKANRIIDMQASEIEHLRVRLFCNRPVEGHSHSTACSIWGDTGTGKTREGFKEPLPCNCGCLINWERDKSASELATLRRRVADGREAVELARPFVAYARAGANNPASYKLDLILRKMDAALSPLPPGRNEG